MSEWIDVNDRTPEIGDTVLLMVSGALSYGWLAGKGEGGLFFNWQAIMDGRLQENPSRVTHWQPLPSLPGTDAAPGEAELGREMYAVCEAVANLWSDSAGPDRNELIAVMKRAQDVVDRARALRDSE